MNETTRPTATRRATQSKASALAELGEGKAIVEETKTKHYVEENKTGNNEVSQFAETNKTQFAPFDFSANVELSETKIQRFIRELNEYSDDNPEFEFTAIVTRKQDRQDDRFTRKCLTDTEFLPFDFTVQGVFQFPARLYRANNDSGGRFVVLVADENTGQFIPTRYYIVVPNDLLPPEEKPQTFNNNNSNSNILDVVKELINNQNQQTERIITAINQQNQNKQPSVLEKAIEAKLLSEITGENKKDVSASMEEKMLNFFLMPQVAEKMANKMFPENVQPETLSTVEKLLNNEALVSKVMETGGNVLNNLLILAAQSKQNQPQNQPQTQPQIVSTPQAIEQPQQIQNPQPQQVQITEEQANEMKELFTKIVSELESDRPLNETNSVLRELKTEYGFAYNIVSQSCKIQPFEQLADILLGNDNKNIVGIVPNELTDKFYDDEGNFNEQGLVLIARLQELYDFWKTN